ncbi:PqqD family protein [Rubrivirga sp.]|uniref:PqqD family protein n=1 Tax=Rubrivirga sp. TaxID=1885344 RepID=UPI003B52209D
MALSPDTVLSVLPGLSVADLGGEAVVLDPVEGEYFGLNEVAARILALIGDGMTLSQVVDHLLTEYEVDRARLEADVRVFVADLDRRGLVTAR